MNAYVGKNSIKTLLGRDNIKKKILENYTLEDVLELYIDKLNASELRAMLKSFDEIANDPTNA